MPKRARPRLVGREEPAVVGLVPRDRVRQAARGVLGAVEEADEGAAAVLAGKVREEDGGYVGVVREGVDEARAGVVQDRDGVVALRGDVRDQRVGEGVAEGGAVVAFGCPGVAEDDARVACWADGWVAALEVPEEVGAVFEGLGDEGVEGGADEAL